MARIIPHFTGIKTAIVGYLGTADTALVCSAWFSCPEILEQLSLLSGADLIVGERPAPLTLNKLHEAKIRTSIPVTKPHAPGATDPPAGMLHHKFIVLQKEQGGVQVPFAVITGSYNYTVTAANNMENIVYIEDPDIAAAYTAEFRAILVHTGILA